eukprot:5714893-Amphidinium_carterae.1
MEATREDVKAELVEEHALDSPIQWARCFRELQGSSLFLGQFRSTHQTSNSTLTPQWPRRSTCLHGKLMAAVKVLSANLAAPLVGMPSREAVRRSRQRSSGMMNEDGSNTARAAAIGVGSNGEVLRLLQGWRWRKGVKVHTKASEPSDASARSRKDQ